jgi:hypothetical protein
MFSPNSPPPSPYVSYAPTSPTYDIINMLEKKVPQFNKITKPRISERLSTRTKVNYKRLHSFGF